MRALLAAVVISALLASCCRAPSPNVSPVGSSPARALPPSPPALSRKMVEPLTAPPMAELATDGAQDLETSVGAIVCRNDGDVRIMRIQPLDDGGCVLVYDNRLSGSGAQNALPNREACERQQQRMQQNFVRSGFRCE